MRVTRVFALVLAGLLLPVLVLAQAKAPGKTGKTRLERPNWLPAPAPAAAAARDVLAFEQNGFIVLILGAAKPVRLDTGHYPAVSSDGGVLAFSPDTRIGIKLVNLADPGLRTLFLPSATPILEKYFSPDGSKLAYRSDTRIDIIAPKPGVPRPQTVVSGLTKDQTLQGFTADGSALVVQDLHHVTWYGLDGRLLRQEPLGTFTDDPWGSSADQYLPDPANADLLLIARGVPASPALQRWAHDAGSALFLFNRASGTSYRLTPENLAATMAAWTPDGRRIYFAGLPESPANGSHKIYRMHADGTGSTEIDTGRSPSVGTRP